MKTLFISAAVIGTVAVCGLMVMLLFFRLKINIGIKRRKGTTIPIEKFFPHTIYGFSVYAAVFGYIGLLLSHTSLPWYLVLPFDLAFSMLVNFFGEYYLLRLVKWIYFGRAPSPDALTGFDAICLEDIKGDEYGRVKFTYNDRTYTRNCISAYHTDLKKNETVTIITGEDDLLFVQKKDEIYGVLNEKT